MSPHPPILSRPVALWRITPGTGLKRWREPFETRALRTALRAGAAGLRAAEALSYRPDLFAQLGPAALQHPHLRATALRHPACAVAMLCRHYEATAPTLEPALAGAGEAVYHLLGWAHGHQRRLRQPPGFYEQILTHDPYWGIRHARRTRNARLLAAVTEWSAEHRRDYGAAAAVFLVRHSREPISPYREALLSNPFYTYWALPRLHPRGLRVGPRDLAGNPKWSFHFARSWFAGEPHAFEAAIAKDPPWMIELAAAQGRLAQPEHRRAVACQLEHAAPDHPLLDAALQFLGPGSPTPSMAADPRAEDGHMPRPLVLGQAAEVRALGALRMNKNTAIWRPSHAQIESDEFKRIVGLPQYTDRGFPRGTVVDGIDAGFAEIKSGSSLLKPTYQLRLQTFRAVAEERALKIYTNRPVDAEFGQWLSPWGVEIKPLPDLLP